MSPSHEREFIANSIKLAFDFTWWGYASDVLRKAFDEKDKKTIEECESKHCVTRGELDIAYKATFLFMPHYDKRELDWPGLIFDGNTSCGPDGKSTFREFWWLMFRINLRTWKPW